MTQYRNAGGNSGIVVYEIGDDYIILLLNNNRKPYIYSYAEYGQDIIEEMKKLAKQGDGLNRFINELRKLKK